MALFANEYLAKLCFPSPCPPGTGKPTCLPAGRDAEIAKPGTYLEGGESKQTIMDPEI